MSYLKKIAHFVDIHKHCSYFIYLNKILDMFKKCFSLFVLLVFGFVLAQRNAYYQQMVKYEMYIDVDATNFTYQGRQNIQYTNNSPDELDIIYMHLYWNAFKPNSMMDQRVKSQGENGDGRLQKNGLSCLESISKGEEGSQNIHWIKQNDKTLEFEIQETILKIYLDKPIKPNSTTNISMEWDANIPKQIRRSGRNSDEGIDMTMTQWYPKISEYDYDGWATFDYIGREFHSPFADYEVSIKIDKDYIIGAGGILQNPSEVKGYKKNPNIKVDKSGKVTWRWEAKNILDFAWAADKDYTVEEFTILEGPKIYFVYQKSEKTKYWDEAKPFIIKYFQIMNNQFGRYIWPTYSFIQGGDGGMEYGMCTMILGEINSLEKLCRLMFHEASHSWYQQMLATNESTKAWLDEGFASYAEEYVMHQLFPPSKPTSNPFVSTLESYIKFVKTGLEQPSSLLADHYDSGRAYSYASYVKGELFLVELGYIMGEQNLAKALKQYYDEWNMKHPSDRDFIHIAQKVSGMDLKWFHNYWINTTKIIDYGIRSVEYEENQTNITLVNNGSIPMPIDFNVLTENNEILTYHIPLNMMRTPKTVDIYGKIVTLPFWNWTQKEYKISIPYGRNQISALGIDFSKRLADINPEDNMIILESKQSEKESEKYQTDAENVYNDIDESEK